MSSFLGSIINNQLIFWALLMALTTPHLSWAAPVTSISTKFTGIKIEPIVGFEQVFRATPTPHTSTRMTYGARLTLGSDRLSLEAEYLKGEDTENYATAPQKIVYKDDKIKLGARSSWNMSNSFFVTARAGGEASKTIKESTTNGVLTVDEGDFKYNPYAGASVGLRIGKDFSVTAGTTVVFRDLSDLTKNDYQNAVSFGYSLR